MFYLLSVLGGDASGVLPLPLFAASCLHVDLQTLSAETSETVLVIDL